VRAAFCEGDRPLTVARSSIPAVDSPDDPAFQAMIRNLVPLLFPRRNPDRFDDDGGPGFLFLGGAFGFGSGLSIGVGAGF
jgi:hypothetical protein